MSKTIVICGYGPGISPAVAQRFGREGFQVALIACSEQRLAAGAAALEASGIRAAAFRADLGDEADIEHALESVRASRSRDGRRHVLRFVCVAQRAQPKRALSGARRKFASYSGSCRWSMH